MNQLLLPLLLAGLVAGVSASGSSSPNEGAQGKRDYATLDVCQMIPGTVVAQALGATLSSTRPFMDKTLSRCTYFVTPAGGAKPLGYAVWVQTASYFEDLKPHIDSPITPIAGLGDGAYTFQDKGDGRFKINVLKRGDLMLQVTGESAASARKVADAVVAHLWKRAP